MKTSRNQTRIKVSNIPRAINVARLIENNYAIVPVSHRAVKVIISKPTHAPDMADHFSKIDLAVLTSCRVCGPSWATRACTDSWNTRKEFSALMWLITRCSEPVRFSSTLKLEMGTSASSHAAGAAGSGPGGSGSLGS